jgi:transposase
MKLPRDITPLSREELLVLVGQLERQVAQLSASLEGLQAENAQLQGSNKRQAAPFSKGHWVNKPKRPGRQPGSGTFSFRQAPKPEEITEPPVEVPAC